MNYIKQYSSLIKIVAPIIAVIAYFLPFFSYSVFGFGAAISGFSVIFNTGFFGFILYVIPLLAAGANIAVNFFPQPKNIKLLLAAGSVIVLLLAAIIVAVPGAGYVGVAWGIGLFLFLIFQAFNAFTIYVSE